MLLVRDDSVLHSSINGRSLWQRTISDINVNPYNPMTLILCHSNMDFQYILDPYSCVQYILNCAGKSNRDVKTVTWSSRTGVSRKLHHKRAREEARKTFLNLSKVSAQEAVHLILGMPLSHSSRSTVFINTGLPNTEWE